MPWFRTLARWGVRRSWKYNKHYADSATLAHARHKRKMRQAFLRIISGQTDFGIRLNSVVTPAMIVQGGTNQIGQRFFEMPGMPNGVLGVFTGEVVHTLGGTWIWTGYSWESYIYPG